MARCTAPKFGHKRGSAALLSCPACGPRGGVVVKSGALVPGAGGELGLDARRALAETSKDSDVLAALAGDEDFGVRWRVAESPNTSAAALEGLTRDEHLGVRWRAAGNPNTPAAALEVLAEDGNPDVRQQVASNPNAPAETLEVLTGDEDILVRQGAAGNPNTPAAAIERLARDTNGWVRSMAAGNPNTPISVVVTLMGDAAPHIASAARSRFASWAQEALDLGSAPTGQLIDMLATLKAWELDPQDPAVTAAIVLCS